MKTCSGLYCLSVCLAAALSTAAIGAEPAASTATKPSLTVTVEQARTAALPVRLGARGNLMPWQEAIVGAEANGLDKTFGPATGAFGLGHLIGDR